MSGNFIEDLGFSGKCWKETEKIIRDGNKLHIVKIKPASFEDDKQNGIDYIAEDIYADKKTIQVKNLRNGNSRFNAPTIEFYQNYSGKIRGEFFNGKAELLFFSYCEDDGTIIKWTLLDYIKLKKWIKENYFPENIQKDGHFNYLISKNGTGKIKIFNNNNGNNASGLEVSYEIIRKHIKDAIIKDNWT